MDVFLYFTLILQTRFIVEMVVHLDRILIGVEFLETLFEFLNIRTLENLPQITQKSESLHPKFTDVRCNSEREEICST